MRAEEKIARQRLSVLELAKALGNVAEACRQRDMNRSQFYEYKRRFQTHGLEGLKDLPPIPKSHPMTTPEEVVEKIIALSLAHPKWGCVRLSAMLKLDGVSVSSPTVQKILIQKGMGNRYDRLLKLEEQIAGNPLDLSSEQIAFIEKNNPAFKERHVESSRPGELLCEDTFYVGRLKGVGKCISIMWSIRSVPSPSASSTRPKLRKRRLRCSTTMFFPFIERKRWKSERFSPTTERNIAAKRIIPSNSISI